MVTGVHPRCHEPCLYGLDVRGSRTVVVCPRGDQSSTLRQEGLASRAEPLPGRNGYRFDFLGGPPGWEVNKQAATKETRILISADGTSVVIVQYNGSPR